MLRPFNNFPSEYLLIITLLIIYFGFEELGFRQTSPQLMLLALSRRVIDHRDNYSRGIKMWYTILNYSYSRHKWQMSIYQRRDLPKHCFKCEFHRHGGESTTTSWYPFTASQTCLSFQTPVNRDYQNFYSSVCTNNAPCKVLRDN